METTESMRWAALQGFTCAIQFSDFVRKLCSQTTPQLFREINPYAITPELIDGKAFLKFNSCDIKLLLDLQAVEYDNQVLKLMVKHPFNSTGYREEVLTVQNFLSAWRTRS